ncbi:hypothetical protein [Yimella sp. cx-51]|uniref:hypothetical protein n=1 Tax=Yimella sp. cx-51 TaxID=2770551 RepID=UPI00165E7B5C|nr:hypothetical protein [Yimella sp. cx-51]MBC9956526.1 hypothetical protein [Yimella sp. cx-51]QTH38369.1 hypothetical protein J5M86_01375 [Yimella sp. cx-51]
MTTIIGDCVPYLAVLGLAEDVAAVQAIMEQQQGKAKTQTFKGPFAHYVSYYKSGVGFVFDEQGLTQVSFYLIAQGGFDAYPGRATLISGIEEYTRDGVRAAFGEPTASRSDDWDLYEVDDRVVHFEYDEEGVVWTVNVMRERVDG